MGWMPRFCSVPASRTIDPQQQTLPLGSARPYASKCVRLLATAMKASDKVVFIGDGWRFLAETAARDDLLTPTSMKRYTELWSRFERFAERTRAITIVDAVDSTLVESFV